MDRVRSAGDAIVTNDMAYFSLLALSKRLGHLHFIVVDGEGHYRSMLRLDEVELPADDPILRNLILVEDMATESVDVITDTDDLHQALEKLLDSGFDKLPVLRTVAAEGVGGDEQGELIGYLRNSDLLRIYDEEIARLNATE